MKKIRLIAILLVLALASLVFVSCGGAVEPECEHTYNGGVCTMCGANDPDYTAVCEHSFANGGCTKCNKACICIFANGACAICGKACNCNFENGACTVCRKSCNCVFVNGACAICGKACNCNFENGACTVCLKACECRFENGACTVCGKACECSFENGACTVCGKEDPAFDGRELYGEMIAKFKALLSYKKANLELPDREENPTVPNYDALYSVAGHYDPSNDIGYSYKDINGDGFVELFLIGPDSRLYALFTLVESEPVFVEAFGNGLGYLYNGENVFYFVKVLNESNFQVKYEFHYTRLVGDRLLGFAYGREDHDGDQDAVTEDIYYYVPEGGERIDFVTDESGTAYDKYKLYSNYIYEYFTGYSTRLSKQSNLIFNSATGAVSEATVTADFSTYDAIIKTFGLMYTDVAGGRYQRSNFTSGKYNDGMIFNTEEDFVLYNKLLAACVLSQNSTSATFGYAKRDLNGDGTDELILLEGTKYYVLAIFTELSGKPVLLDTYNDLKVAFIDAKGSIHVFERIIPGSKKDFEYFVYTVDADKLKVNEAFGVKCDAKGTAETEWYKITDGSHTDISKTEFEALLEEYFLTLGTVNASNAAKYTKENSGLEFILAYTPEE